MQDGNFVTVSYNDIMQTKLTEFDTNGTVVCQHQSSLFAYGAVCHVDRRGRIVVAEWFDRFEPLDSKFNVMEVSGPLPDGD